MGPLSLTALQQREYKTYLKGTFTSGLCGKKTFLKKKKKRKRVLHLQNFSLWNMVFSRHAWDDVNISSPAHSALWLTHFWADDTLPAGPDMGEPPQEGLRLSACLLNEIKNLSWISQSLGQHPTPTLMSPRKCWLYQGVCNPGNHRHLAVDVSRSVTCQEPFFVGDWKTVS